MTKTTQTWLIRIAIVAVIVGAAYLIWQAVKPDSLPKGFASGNGSIEGMEIDVATKIAGA